MRTPKALAIIPARGGSKRIPKKNIRDFCGAPIIAYSIRAALESDLFDVVMVSTDAPDIARIAQESGAQVPFFRSDQTANDSATLADALLEVLREYEARGETFEYYCCILPTAPLIRAADLKRSFEMIGGSGADSLVSVVRFSFPIWRALRLKDRKMEMFWPEYMHQHSQNLEPAYHDAGQFYWGRVESLKSHRRLYGPDCLAYELEPTAVQDIDSEDDWQIAEMKYKLRNPSSVNSGAS